MGKREKLFALKNAYDTAGSKELFFEAVKESWLFHYKNCPEYRKIMDELGFSADMLQSYKDIYKIPPLPTLIFKKYRLFSMPEKRMLIKATSSGTGGNASTVGYDTGALLCALNMSLKVAHRRRLLSVRPANYIVMGYKPHKSNKTAAAKTAYAATLMTPALSRTYALKYRNGEYLPDLEGVSKAAVKYSGSRFPLRFMGFPAYTYFLLKLMDEKKINVRLPKGSKVMLGGGWKQFYAEQPDKQDFYRLTKKVLGVDEENVIEFFGAAEHPILYCDCKNHHFHIPVYSRVIIRDVNTLKPVPMGTVGLVNLITPMIKATPVLSVMTDDLGVIRSGKDCGCGLKSPYLEIIGRVGMKDIKTCAAGAAEILGKADIL